MGAREEVKTNKKGKFTIGGVERGTYTPVIETPGLLLVSVEFSARWPTGEQVAQFKEENVRQAGVPSFQMVPFYRAELDLVVTKAVEQKRTGAELSAALDPAGKLTRLNALFDLSKWDDLLVESEAVLGENPDLGGAHYLRGVALWRLGRLDEAIEEIRLGVELKLDQPGIWGVLGSALLQSASSLRGAGQQQQAVVRFGEAADAISRQLEATPDSSVHLNNLVIALEGAERPDETVAVLNRLLEVAPERKEVYLRLAEVLTAAGRPEEAVEVLQRAPEPGPEFGVAIYNVAVVLWNQEKNEATLEAVNRAIELLPDQALVHRLRGRALIAVGQIPEGVEELKVYLRMAPDDPEAEAERELVEMLEQAGK